MFHTISHETECRISRVLQSPGRPVPHRVSPTNCANPQNVNGRQAPPLSPPADCSQYPFHQRRYAAANFRGLRGFRAQRVARCGCGTALPRYLPAAECAFRQLVCDGASASVRLHPGHARCGAYVEPRLGFRLACSAFKSADLLAGCTLHTDHQTNEFKDREFCPREPQKATVETAEIWNRDSLLQPLATNGSEGSHPSITVESRNGLRFLTVLDVDQVAAGV